MSRLIRLGRNSAAKRAWILWILSVIALPVAVARFFDPAPARNILLAATMLAGSLLILVRPFPRKIPVLNYHSVSADPRWMPGPLRDSVSPELFERQLVYLKKHGYQTLFISELHDMLSGHAASDRRAKYVALTFDDGYADNWVGAFPLLRKHGMKATFFVSAGLVDPDDRKRATLGDASGAALEWAGYATWPELLEMQSSGLAEIESHGTTHRILAGESLRDDITGARRMLADRLGKNVDYLCWPKNMFTAEGERIAEEAGYRATVSNLHDSLNIVGENPRRISRIFVGSSFLGFNNLACDLAGFVLQQKLFEGCYFLYPLLAPIYALRRLRTNPSCQTTRT